MYSSECDDHSYEGMISYFLFKRLHYDRQIGNTPSHPDLSASVNELEKCGCWTFL